MTKTSSLTIYETKEQCTQAVALIQESIKPIRSPYDLVRLTDTDIATQENKKVVAHMILDLNKFVSISKPMNEYQIIETVNMMLQEYPRLTLHEYQFFFNKVKAGYYGHFYESLDGVKLMVFLKEFYQEVCKAWNEKIDESEYQRKIKQQTRDIDQWKQF